MRRFVVVVLVMAACRLPTPGTGLASLCTLSRPPRDHSDTLRIVLPEAVDAAHAPRADSEVERFVFSQLYEPLVQQDCAGITAPGLAESWTRMSDSAWRFRLRPGATFSDGTAATAPAVAAILTGVAPQWRIAASGDRDVVVQGSGGLQVLAALAAPHLAIAKSAASGQWPAGTVGRITPTTRGVTLTRANGVLALTWPLDADARDLLDGGADAVLTDQPAALEYAAARGAFDAIPLAWSRTYVVVVPSGGTVGFAEAGGVWRDAVRGEARQAVGPFWWATAKCAGAAAPAGAAARARVLYRQGDAHAQGLAERFVARGASGSPADRREVAVGLSATELATALTAGTDFAIVALPRSTGDACATLVAHGLAGRPARELIPMLDTRFQFLVRAGRFGVSLDGNGTPRLEP